jgi:hypothetical protein
MTTAQQARAAGRNHPLWLDETEAHLVESALEKRIAQLRREVPRCKTQASIDQCRDLIAKAHALIRAIRGFQ